MSTSTDDITSNDSSSDLEDDDQVTKKEELLMLLVVSVVNYFTSYVVKSPRRDSSLTGHRWVSEILSGHPIRCYQMFRMKKPVFLHLCDTLQDKYNLKPTRNVGIHEQVALFLYMLGQPGSVCNLEERFQHSGETISRHFHSVLKAMCKLATDIIRPVDSSFRDVPNEIRNDSRYYPYFKDCIGAIDGTHIRVCVPPHLQASYIGRKGYTTTNFMAVCDFNMCFTFVWAGWEGSAHDTKIFMEAVRRPSLHFPHPPQGKYYLVDAGYPTFMGFLGPYKKNRYHLPQFRNGPRIRGRVEVFNYYHSSLRSTTERSFGCCKARWKILGNMPSFDLKTRSKIITACMTLHNFIRRNDRSDEEFDVFDENYEYEDNDDGEENEAGPSTITWEEPDAQSSLQMEQMRESIKNMFPAHV